MSFLFVEAQYRIFVNKFESLPGYLYTLPQRGNSVIFKHANFPVTLAKRVIDLTGDKVSFKKDTILVKNKPVGVLQRMTSKGKILSLKLCLKSNSLFSVITQ